MQKWIEELVPEGSVREILRVRTLRRRVRYWCFRFRSQEEGVSKATGQPKGLRRYYEKQEWFDGWENFGATWDLDPDDPMKTKPRWETIHEEWDKVLEEELRTNKIATRKNIRKGAVSNGSEGEL